MPAGDQGDQQEVTPVLTESHQVKGSECVKAEGWHAGAGKGPQKQWSQADHARPSRLQGPQLSQWTSAGITGDL